MALNYLMFDIITTLSVHWLQIILTTACIFLVYKIIKQCIAATLKEANINTNKRALGCSEQILDILSNEFFGFTNICLAITLTSKESVAQLQEHVRDAVILLAKRQPMLRAVINTNTADRKKYFEIKDIDEVMTMLNITTAGVRASHWKDVWFEYTQKPIRNGLLWRITILQEEFLQGTRDYTIMCNFHHACMDGTSTINFCKQLLKTMNDLAGGTVSVEEKVPSLYLQSPYHDLVVRGRVWHSIFYFLLAINCGVRSILRLIMRKILHRSFDKKPNNPYYEQFPPPKLHASPVVPSRLIVKVFTQSETKNFIQACKANNCTVTGAITAAAHLAFCELIKSSESNDLGLETIFAINGRRFCYVKPAEDYMGYFVYMYADFYMKYAKQSAQSDFWMLASDVTRRLKDVVRKEPHVVEETILEGLLGPREMCELFVNKRLFPKSASNFISSFGYHDFVELQRDRYKLKECVANNLVHNMNCVFFHYNYCVNGKMTWTIISNHTVDGEQSKKFAEICFKKLPGVRVTLCRS